MQRLFYLETKMFPHIFVSKMMKSTRKGKARDAAPDPGTVVLSKLSMAASEARNATMASIAELVDDAAAKNGGRVPKDFIPKVIQQFSIAAPGLNRDKINFSSIGLLLRYLYTTQERLSWSFLLQRLAAMASSTMEPNSSGDCPSGSSILTLLSRSEGFKYTTASAMPEKP